jgi:hypothetical protein
MVKLTKNNEKTHKNNVKIHENNENHLKIKRKCWDSTSRTSFNPLKPLIKVLKNELWVLGKNNPLLYFILYNLTN